MSGTMLSRWVDRKEEGKHGSAVRFGLAAAKADSAVVLLNDVAADPEAESGIRSFFGREEWLKNKGFDCRRHTDAAMRFARGERAWGISVF
ncbi:MAG: hypothetical protein ACXVBO_16450 [Isosphaeraceae bacterium]